MDLQMMRVDRVVVHRLPRKEPKHLAAEQVAVDLAQAVSPLDDTFRQYLQLRLTGSLTSAKAFDVRFSGINESAVPEIVRDYLIGVEGGWTDDEQDDALVDLSQRAANLLFELQPVPPPASLFAVIAGRLRIGPFIAMLKLEHERGVTVDDTQTEDGRRTFEIHVQDGLVMTGSTKVFKAGLFEAIPGRAAGDGDGGGGDGGGGDGEKGGFIFPGVASDDQAPKGRSHPLATYFVEKFLSCKLLDEPRVITERAFNVVQNWINKNVDDPSERVKAEQALLVELSSNKNTFGIRQFGRDHLGDDQRKALESHARDNDLPVAAFAKDTETIRAQLDEMVLEFDEKVRIVAPKARFDDGTVGVDSGHDGDAVVVVRGRLRRTRGT